MTIRIQVPGPLAVGETVRLPEGAAHHAGKVLRLEIGAAVVLFDGRGGEYAGECVEMTKGLVAVQLSRFSAVDRESPLHLTLVQGISRGERMDYTLQKAVELGVAAVTPVFTSRCMVALAGERRTKREEHWRGVIRAACEQSGRTRIPQLAAAVDLTQFLSLSPRDRGEQHSQDRMIGGVKHENEGGPVEDPGTGTRLTLSPGAALRLSEAPIHSPVTLAVGPEGGFAPDELRLLHEANYLPVRLGPRILRTETAALVALSILQSLAGDL